MWPSQCDRGAPPHLGHRELRKQEILFARIQLELFKKLLPHQCLGSVWSKRNKPGSEHLAPTVRATVTQFNCVAKCVITTCLGNPSMTARDRAIVVEHWIKVAKACQTLRNYSSLRAILSALQSVSIHRLENTWGEGFQEAIEDLSKAVQQGHRTGQEPTHQGHRVSCPSLALSSPSC
ncbi:ral guanine nucleotide dissociation stimulator-like [Ursus arctos]|uniref:ral guanine nucleotide dissociation stimulator-like n=1 Tax=Ursus arctos TaxID=9644 RepID=UPI002546DC1D|nr:ral guanine nucleotide dissociation stimulator-like [Ursus arctos]XP_057168799.1 ral guanine nucleotide dissociation stimulator-like [Ursus arctos]XP_057168800.1 ral guanine nucleotide dissociation stimulator-like [Ursus arctos]XP_057168801.1 ral guanine nucleotide dissociation stimulator-like [Ursus arctos]